MQRGRWAFVGYREAQGLSQPRAETLVGVGSRLAHGYGDGDRGNNNNLLSFSIAFLEGPSWSEGRGWNKMKCLFLRRPEGGGENPRCPHSSPCSPVRGFRVGYHQKPFPRQVT